MQWEDFLNFNVAVLVATHNRSNLTLRSLRALRALAPANWKLHIYLVDDGSTDDTVSSLESLELKIHVTKGPGNWFWARSMFEAENSVVGKPDAFLWMNDDIQLNHDALMRFEAARLRQPNSILVGQFSDQSEKRIVYGGLIRDKLRPMRFYLEYCGEEMKSVDTFNGNLVLVPWDVSMKVGHIEGRYAHAYADIDYGLRASKFGVEILVVPGYSGVCLPNKSEKLSLGNRIRKIHSPKGQPLKSQLLFLRQHGRWYWPLFLLTPYLRAILNK